MLTTNGNSQNITEEHVGRVENFKDAINALNQGVESLIFENVKFSSEEERQFAHALTKNNHLKSLCIQGSPFSIEGEVVLKPVFEDYEHIAKDVISPTKHVPVLKPLEELKFSAKCEMKEDESFSLTKMVYLKEALATHSSLEHLTIALPFKSFSEELLDEIFQTPSSKNKIRSLAITFTDGEANLPCLEYLSQLLKSHPYINSFYTNGDSQESSVWVSYFVEAIKNNPNVHQINLQGHQVGEEILLAALKAVLLNPFITNFELDFDYKPSKPDNLMEIFKNDQVENIKLYEFKKNSSLEAYSKILKNRYNKLQQLPLFIKTKELENSLLAQEMKAIEKEVEAVLIQRAATTLATEFEKINSNLSISPAIERNDNQQPLRFTASASTTPASMEIEDDQKPLLQKSPK